MTEHIWDDATHTCTRCAVQKGAHAIECLATPNVVGMHHLRIRQLWEREGRMHGLDYPPTLNTPGKIAVEYFPQATTGERMTINTDELKKSLGDLRRLSSAIFGTGEFACAHFNGPVIDRALMRPPQQRYEDMWLVILAADAYADELEKRQTPESA